MARKLPPEQIAGRFAGLPHTVMDSMAFMGASHHARSLLLELIRQHTGKNNGHFQLAKVWLYGRGWNSSAIIQRAKSELVLRQLAIKTRLGGLNAGPDLWAVTWLPIYDYSKLTEVSAKSYHPGAWHFLDKALPIGEKSTPEKRDARTTERTSSIPQGGLVTMPTVPPSGTDTVLLSSRPVPRGGHYEVTSTPGRSVARRIVGKKRVAATSVRESASPHRDVDSALHSTGRVYRLIHPTGFSYRPPSCLIRSVGRQ